jgi:hypothetical protein
MTSSSHYECALVQADAQADLEQGANDGDDKDLFRHGGNDRFADSTQPNSKWWDGTSSRLDIRDISDAGPAMTFLTRL